MFPFASLSLSYLALVCALGACGTTPAPSSSAMDAGAVAGGPNLVLPAATCPDAATTMHAPGVCTPLRVRGFSSEIAPLFNGCAGEVCHDFGSGGIVSLVGLSEPECCNELLGIDPGHPETSYLLRKLSGQGLCAGARMPLDRTPLSADALQAVSDWICAGAHTTP